MAKRKSKYYVRPDGLHQAIRTINGKRVYFYGRTDAEVERKMIAYKETEKRGLLFSEIAEMWWEEKEPKLAFNSTKNYIPAYERAKAHFGSMPVKEITASEINSFVAAFARQQHAAKTTATQLMVVRQILDYAAIKDYIAVNPANVVKVPRGLPRQYRQAPTAEEISVIKTLREKSYGLLPYLIYMTGCRYGEAFALRYEDIDRKAKSIHIHRSVYYVGRTPNTKEPKTASGDRTVPLLDGLAEILPGRKRGYVFSDDNGDTPLSKTQADNLYREFKRKSGLPITAHQIRHAYATALAEADVPPKVMQVLLGHAQLATTMDIYTHVRDTTISDAAAKMNNSF